MCFFRVIWYLAFFNYLGSCASHFAVCAYVCIHCFYLQCLGRLCFFNCGLSIDKRGYPHNIFLISRRKHMRGPSYEYPQHMFSSRNKKDIIIFRMKKKRHICCYAFVFIFTILIKFCCTHMLFGPILTQTSIIKKKQKNKNKKTHPPPPQKKNNNNNNKKKKKKKKHNKKQHTHTYTHTHKTTKKTQQQNNNNNKKNNKKKQKQNSLLKLH